MTTNMTTNQSEDTAVHGKVDSPPGGAATPRARSAFSAPLASLLAALEQHDIADAAQRQRLADGAAGSGWFTSLQALAAWLTATLVVVAVAVGSMASDAYILFGGVLVATALAIFWSYRDSAFANQLALALSLSGQAMLAFDFIGHNAPHSRMLVSMAVAVALSLVRTTTLHRSACLLLAMWAGYYHAYPVALGLLGLALAALAVALWLARGHWALWRQKSGYMAALAHSVTFAGLTLLLVYYSDAPNAFNHRAVVATVHRGATAFEVYAAGTALLWLACVAWLTRQQAARDRGWLLGVALAIGALGWYSTPTALVCLALTLATFHACQRSWCVFTLVCAGILVGCYYYSLHQTLLMKSASLAALGVLFLALAWLARRWQRRLS